MADNAFNFNFEDMFKKMANGESVELPEKLLETLSGGVLDDARKKELQDLIRYFKGFWGDYYLDGFLEWERDHGVDEETLEYCKEIWPTIHY